MRFRTTDGLLEEVTSTKSSLLISIEDLVLEGGLLLEATLLALLPGDLLTEGDLGIEIFN